MRGSGRTCRAGPGRPAVRAPRPPRALSGPGRRLWPARGPRPPSPGPLCRDLAARARSGTPGSDPRAGAEPDAPPIPRPGAAAPQIWRPGRVAPKCCPEGGQLGGDRGAPARAAPLAHGAPAPQIPAALSARSPGTPPDLETEVAWSFHAPPESNRARSPQNAARRWPAGARGCFLPRRRAPSWGGPSKTALLTFGPWAPPFLLRGSCLGKGGAACRLLAELSPAVCRSCSCCWHRDRDRGSNLAPCTGQPPRGGGGGGGGARPFLACVCAGHSHQLRFTGSQVPVVTEPLLRGRQVGGGPSAQEGPASVSQGGSGCLGPARGHGLGSLLRDK